MDKHSVLYEVDESYTVLRALVTHFRACPADRQRTAAS